MRTAILTSLLGILSGSALAARVAIHDDESTVVYVDPSTIRKSGDIVKMSQLTDFTTARIPYGGERFRYSSSKAHNEYDCKEKRARVLSFTWYSNNMGKGKEVYSTSKPGKWEPVVPESIIGYLWQFACGQR